MIEKLKKIVDFRLGVTVALGICIGQLAYRIILGALDGWANGATSLESVDQNIVLGVPILAAVAYVIWRLVRRYLYVHKLRTQGLPVPVWPAPRTSHL